MLLIQHTSHTDPGPLLQGVPKQETRITCTACAGTLLLEFGLLSRLTEDSVYEDKARAAAAKVYGERNAGLFI